MRADINRLHGEKDWNSAAGADDMIVSRKAAWLVPIALVATGAGLARAVGLWERGSGVERPAIADVTDPARAGAAARTVAALGRLEPQSELVQVGAGLSDRLETLNVSRGDRVEKDQVLGRLAGYDEQVAQRDQIAAQIGEAKIKLALQMELEEARISSAEIKTRQVDEVSPKKLAAQVATIQGLDATLKNDNSLLLSDAQLLSSNASSRQSYDRRATLVLQDKANLASAQAHLEELKQQYVLDKLDSDMQVRIAKAALARVKADFALDVLQKQFALAEARVRRMEVRAPIAGRILNIIAHAGEQVGATPVLTMGDTDRMRAVAEVYETDAAAIRLGQRAKVTSRALPVPLAGTVVGLGQMIFKNDVLNVDPAAKADARVMEVRVELDDAIAAERFSNLTVDVLIDTGDGAAPRAFVKR